MLDGARPVQLAGVQKEPAPHEAFVHAFQTLDGNVPDIQFGSRLDVEGHIEHRLGLVLVGDGRVDLGEGIALILEHHEHPRAGSKHS